MAAGGISHIIRALGANFLIACAKGVGTVLTGSASMLAETIHSLSDCVNQILLLVGIKQAQRPPDKRYPLGQGRNLYFWSFIVALLLFLGGGLYSAYEGIHKLQHKGDIDNPGIAIGILAFGFAIEMWALIGVVKVANLRRGKTSFWRYLRESKDSDVVVIFGEDLAAVCGLGVALIAVAIAWATGDSTWDAIGTLGIAAVLIAVAFFLAIEIRSLLIGEAADPEVERICRDVAKDDPNLERVIRVLTIQQGPGQVVAALKCVFKPGLTTGGPLEDAINAFERELEKRCPQIIWSFVEADNTDE